MTDDQQRKLQAFLTNAIPLEKSGLGARFSFVAVERDGTWVLVAGRLERNADLWAQPELTYENSKVMVRSYHLSELKLSIEEMVANLVGGRLHTPFGEFDFPSGGSDHAIFPFHLCQMPDGRLIDRLQITGVQRNEIEKYPNLNWAVDRLGEKPDTFHALLEDWGFDPVHGAIKVDIIDLPVATIEPASAFDGRATELTIVLPCRPACKKDPVIGVIGV